MEHEFEQFIARVRNTAGTGTSMEMTIDYKVAEIMGLKHGDTVKVMIKKMPQGE